jgi:hypothetical protein
MVTTVRREIARKHANAPIKSPPNVMRPRPWEHTADVEDSPEDTSSNRVLSVDIDMTRSRYHLPDFTV